MNLDGVAKKTAYQNGQMFLKKLAKWLDSLNNNSEHVQHRSAQILSFFHNMGLKNAAILGCASILSYCH